MCGNIFKNPGHALQSFVSNPVKAVEKGWTGVRDAAETAASLVGNYYLPGSSIVSDRLVSKGAQKALNSPLGKIGQIASGLAGGGFGEDFTGIPASSGWSDLLGGTQLGNTFGLSAPEGGSFFGNALGGTPSGTTIGESLGLTGENGVFGSASLPETNLPAGSAAVSPTSVATTTPTSLSDGFNYDINGNAIGSSATNPLSGNVGSGTVGTASVASDPAIGIPNGFLTGTPSAAGTPLPAAVASSDGGFLSHPGQSIIDAISKNPVAALNIAATGASTLMGNKPAPGENQIKDIAATDQAQGQKLQEYLTNGTLPPGVQQNITAALQADIATIKSRYASMGMSGSSSEQQDIAAAEQRAQAAGSQVAMQLLNTGIAETGSAANLYQGIANQNIQQDQNLMQVIREFASNLAGGTTNDASRGGKAA